MLLLDFLDQMESVQIVNDNARLPARSSTLSAPPVRRRRDRDAWKRRSSSSDLESSPHQQPLHVNDSWLQFKHNISRPSSTVLPTYNRWDTNCSMTPTPMMKPSLMLMQQPKRYDSKNNSSNCSPPKKPVRRMNSLEPSRDTARLLEQALLITHNCCASCEF